MPVPPSNRRRQYSVDDWVSLADRIQHPDDGPNTTTTEARAAKLARELVRSLSSRDREALTRFYLEEQPIEQICREMGLTAMEFHLIKHSAKSELGKLRVASGKSAPDVSKSRAALRAIRIFGDVERANAWLQEPNAAFHGLTPAQMILNNGQQEVIDTLGRIQFGVLS